MKKVILIYNFITFSNSIYNTERSWYLIAVNTDRDYRVIRCTQINRNVFISSFRSNRRSGNFILPFGSNIIVAESNKLQDHSNFAAVVFFCATFSSLALLSYSDIFMYNIILRTIIFLSQQVWPFLDYIISC